MFLNEKDLKTYFQKDFKHLQTKHSFWTHKKFLQQTILFRNNPSILLVNSFAFYYLLHWPLCWQKANKFFYNSLLYMQEGSLKCKMSFYKKNPTILILHIFAFHNIVYRPFDGIRPQSFSELPFWPIISPARGL